MKQYPSHVIEANDTPVLEGIPLTSIGFMACRAEQELAVTCGSCGKELMRGRYVVSVRVNKVSRYFLAQETETGLCCGRERYRVAVLSDEASAHHLVKVYWDSTIAALGAGCVDLTPLIPIARVVRPEDAVLSSTAFVSLESP